MSLKKMIASMMLLLGSLSISNSSHAETLSQTPLTPPPVGTMETLIEPPEGTFLKFGNRFFVPDHDAEDIEALLGKDPEAAALFQQYATKKKSAKRWLAGGIASGVTSIVAGVALMMLTQRPAPGLALGGIGSFSYGIGLGRSRSLEQQANSSLQAAADRFNGQLPAGAPALEVIHPDSLSESRDLYPRFALITLTF